MLRAHGGIVSSAVRLMLAAALIGGIALYGLTAGRIKPAGAAGAAGGPEVSLESGYFHTLLVASNGALWAWGHNSRGQLGLGDRNTRLSPVQVGTDTNWKSVSAGWYHSLAVRTDGTLWAWGDNSSGQLGTGNREAKPRPVQVGADANWVAVAAGQAHSLGLRADGTLWAWGSNENNCMGVAGSTRPSRVGTAGNWVSIAAADSHSLGVRRDGTLWSWGRNESFELGLGHANDRSGLNRVGTGTDWVSAAADFRYSMAIRRDGTLWAWGWNTQGQLGLGDVDRRAVPTQIGEASWAGVFPGRVHCLGIQSDGTLWAWGTNYDGELGLGDLMERLAPARVDNLAWAVASCGDAFSTGVQANGTVWGWGRGESGQPGTGSAGSAYRPAQCPMPDMDWPPAVNTVAASRVLGSAAYLNGYLYSLGVGSTSARVSFQWGPETSYGSATEAQTMTATGAWSTEITGLEPETWYHFRARVESDKGASYGADMSFKTNTTAPAPPEVKTRDASMVTGSSARLNGVLAGMGTACSLMVSFEYGAAEGACDLQTRSDTMGRAGGFWADVTDLAPGTTYYFRARACGDGEDLGGVYSFTTAGPPAHPPTVETGGADRLTTRSARIHGELTGLGTASNVTVVFDWGQSPGSYMSESTAIGRPTTGAFYCDLDGLLAGRTYYYRARAVGDGTGCGQERHFIVPAVVPAPASISPNRAGLGQTAAVTVTGSDFANCIGLDLGPGIRVDDYTVVSGNQITAHITLADDLIPGPRDVTVKTVNGSYALEGGFVVRQQTSDALPLWVWGVAAGVGALACGGALFVMFRPRRPPSP